MSKDQVSEQCVKFTIPVGERQMDNLQALFAYLETFEKKAKKEAETQ